MMATDVIKFKNKLKLFWDTHEEIPTDEFFQKPIEEFRNYDTF